MCLLLIAHNCCAGYRLVVAANRDEFHARATAAAERWDDSPNIIGGRDKKANGTWLALDEQGRFATITNVRSGRNMLAPRSRGLIVTDYLGAPASPATFIQALAADGDNYEGFNVLAYAARELHWYSNQAAAPQRLGEGIYTLSNALLDTSWPKTERLRAGFADVFRGKPNDPVESLLSLLRDGHQAAHSELPDTGVGHDMERILSSIFIVGDVYGTRCSTIILIDDANNVTFHERRYDADARVSGDTHIEFELAESAT